MDRFALIWHRGHYIPVRETELERLGNPRVHCVYTGHAAGAHAFAEWETRSRLRGKPTSEAGLAIERKRKLEQGGFRPLVPAPRDEYRRHLKREFKGHAHRKERSKEEYP